jgi:hypothetical protein
MTGSLADGVLRRDWSKINAPRGTFGPISTSERPRNRTAGSMPSERQLCAVYVSKAVIPLTAKPIYSQPKAVSELAAGSGWTTLCRRQTSDAAPDEYRLCKSPDDYRIQMASSAYIEAVRIAS